MVITYDFETENGTVELQVSYQEVPGDDVEYIIENATKYLYDAEEPVEASADEVAEILAELPEVERNIQEIVEEQAIADGVISPVGNDNDEHRLY